MFGGGGGSCVAGYSGGGASSGRRGDDNGDDDGNNDDKRWKGKLDTRWVSQYEGEDEETDDEVSPLYWSNKRFSGVHFSLNLEW